MKQPDDLTDEERDEVRRLVQDIDFKMAVICEFNHKAASCRKDLDEMDAMNRRLVEITKGGLDLSSGLADARRIIGDGPDRSGTPILDALMKMRGRN